MAVQFDGSVCKATNFYTVFTYYTNHLLHTTPSFYYFVFCFLVTLLFVYFFFYVINVDPYELFYGSGSRIRYFSIRIRIQIQVKNWHFEVVFKNSMYLTQKFKCNKQRYMHSFCEKMIITFDSITCFACSGTYNCTLLLLSYSYY